MLTRGTGAELEVFFVKRSQHLQFFGGSWAFPGGVLDGADEDLARRLVESGAPPTADRASRSHEPDENALLVCALRELFEETGVLLEPLSSAMPNTTDAGRAERARLRAGLLPRDGATSEALLTWEALCAPFAKDGTLLVGVESIGRITTPAFRPLRYHTLFLHAELPTGEQPKVIIGELEKGRFESPAAVLARWNKGEQDVVPPVLFLLEILAREIDRSVESGAPPGNPEVGSGESSSLAAHGLFSSFLSVAGEALAAIAKGRLHAAYTSPGILAAPLRTPTLPPAETTNTYLVGIKDVYVIDPATYEEAERERLWETLDRWESDGRRVRGVILTHRHADHIGSSFAVTERYGVPLWAHPLTLRDLEPCWEDPGAQLGGRPRDMRAVGEGDGFELGTAPDGSTDWRLIVRHTPGHAEGHISLHDSRYGTAIVGDMVSTISTIVIDPPEGHLATYLGSLERLIEVAPGPVWALLPAHGPWVSDGARLVRHYLEHRGERESALLGALGDGLGSIAELTPRVYSDTPESLWPYAERSLTAGLEKLVEEGRAQALGGAPPRWAALPTLP